MGLQIHSDISESAPFLVINDKKRINVLPVLYLHEEAPVTCMGPWTEVPHVTVDFEFPLEKWIHVGCEVSYVTHLRISLCYFLYVSLFMAFTSLMSFALYSYILFITTSVLNNKPHLKIIFVPNCNTHN